MVRIGHASIDEHGTIKGGKAGDQTGKELCVRNYYLHKKGWRVFRAKDPKYRAKIAEGCLLAVNNDYIGYDQSNRDSLWNYSKPYNYNPGKVKEKCETDCSALVRVCCAYAGIILQNFNTSSEPSVLLNSGYFIEVKDVDLVTGKGLLEGDILDTKTKGHTATVVSVDDQKTEGFYPKYEGESNSIINALSSVGENDTSKVNRAKIAAVNGVDNYTGTMEQNIYLLSLLKKGELKKFS